MKNVFKNGVLFLMISLLFLACIIYSSEVSNGVVQGIDYCLYVLIPALFPFMFLSSLFSNTSLSFYVSRACQNFTRHVLKLPPECFNPVVFGLLFGYPVGAKLVAGIYEEGLINDEQKNRLMLFVVNPGISFTVLFVGGVVLKNINLGILMLISTICASLLMAIFLGALKPVPPKCTSKNYMAKSNIIEKAARASLSATVGMCIHVIIFSAFIPLLYVWGVDGIFGNEKVQTLFFMSLDVIHGVELAREMGSISLIYVMGLSFGGLCVHLQAFSFFKNKAVNFWKFYLARIVNMFISCGVFSLLIRFFPQSSMVFSDFSATSIQSFSGTALGSIALLLLSAMYIYINE